jgi:hypothetical protein
MFRGKQRPKGLEFPSCRACNNGTSKSDLVASLLGRVSPDATTKLESEEFRKLLSAISNNVPGLLEEMQIDEAGQRLARRELPIEAGGGVLKADGPLATHHMGVFAAKLGFALHFEATGSAIPTNGGVQPRWFSNAQAAVGQIPSELFQILPSPRTLQQGAREVSDQFQYAWVVSPGWRHSLFYAVFRQSFAVAAVSALDRTAFITKHADKFPTWCRAHWAILRRGSGARRDQSGTERRFQK